MHAVTVVARSPTAGRGCAGAALVDHLAPFMKDVPHHSFGVRTSGVSCPFTSRSIQERFEAFHALNPWVLRHLEALAADCVAKGFRRVGIGMLFKLLRWRYGEATHGDAFRLNNNFRSRYVRLLIERHPEWVRLFETRALRAA